MSSRALYAICFVLLLAFAVMRFRAFHQTTAAVVVEPDSVQYLDTALAPLCSRAFWAGIRPIGIPFIYKLLPHDVAAITNFQMCFSIACWGLLALAIAGSIREAWVQLLAFVVMLGVGSLTMVIVWDRAILSEAITLGLFALLYAMALRLLSKQSLRNAALVGAVAAYWAVCRDSNALLIGAAAPLLAVCAMLLSISSEARRNCWVLSAVFLLAFVVNSLAPSIRAQRPDDLRGERWTFSFLNIVTWRILPDPSARAWFEGHGMPVTPALLRFSGIWSHAFGYAIYTDPELESFRRWVADDGVKTYARYLLDRPMLFAAPLSWMPAMLSPVFDDPTVSGDPTIPIAHDGGEELPWYVRRDLGAGFEPVLGRTVSQLLYPSGRAFLAFWPITSGAVILLGIRRWRADPRWILPLTMAALMYPHAMIVWFADAMDISRHALQIKLQFCLASWMAVLFLLDEVVARRASLSDRAHLWS